jgi:hypothetical protein
MAFNPASHHPGGEPRVLSDGKRIWHVTTLWAAAAGLTPRPVPVSEIREMDEICWFSDAWGKKPTCRAVADHCRRIMTADLSVPIILGPLGDNPLAVLDGMHRAARCLLENRPTIDAVILEAMPAPDEMLKADDPRYER